MSDVNANIGVNIDSSQALAELKRLQRQLSEFNLAVAKSNQTAALAQKSLQRNLIDSINSIGSFSAELRTVNTTAESFTKALEGNKLSMREYFRYAGASTKTFGQSFKSELDTISKVAEERVKTLQTQYIKLGRDANGAMKAIAVRPLVLDMDSLATKTQLAAQKQAIFNQVMRQGSTQLLNFGKNTQWAGRQLMVGFTLPLAAFGAAASKAFRDLETEVIRFKKVYGDLGTNPEETEKALKGIRALADGYTKYGVEVSKTVGVASQAAAAGFKNADLIAQTEAATKLAILGQIEQQQALETTISLQNAFKISSTELATTIDFLNAVENQTVTSLDDITTAIPKVAPVIQSLGGDVKDLAFFLTAMKEGGINASEGANALKSGLASLINPTNKATAMLGSMGINIDAIVTKNAGNLKKTVVEFAQELDKLDPLSRARAIETMFGKFQFARISTLLNNVTQQGTQASRVLDLASQSASNLASLTEKELGTTAESALIKFQGAVAKLKASLAPVGEVFMDAVAPILEFVSKVLDKFNGLSDGTKKFIAITVGVIGGLGPILLMTFGLLANGVANIIKLFMTLRNGYQRLTGQSQNLGEQTQYLTNEQLEAAAAAHSLEQSHARLTQQFSAEAGAVNQLRLAYEQALSAAVRFASVNPGMMRTPKNFADGGVVVSGPGGPKDDRVPANLSNGEVVLSVDTVKKNPGVVSSLLSGGKVRIPGYAANPGSVVGSIAENFLGTRIGRSASGGEKAQVNIPGGYQLGHYAEPIQMTGAQLRASVANEAQTLKNAVEALIASVGGSLETVFDVFTNQVTIQSKEFNQLLGEAGSGKTAPVSMFRTEAVNQAGAYNAPLIREMKKAGASTEEITSAVQQLATEFENGINDLGQVTTVTAEDVNRITQEAYDRVADTRDDVRRAKESLARPGAIKEKVGVTSGRTPYRGGYNTKTVREEINAVVQNQAPGLYPTQQAFNFTGDAARRVGVQNAVAIRQIFDQLDAEAKARIFRLVGNIDAMSQQVIAEAQRSGIDIGRYAVQGVAQGAETASPSDATRRTAKDIIEGLRMELAAGQRVVAAAGTKVGQTAVQSVDIGVANGVKKRRVSYRPQGPAPIGVEAPAGATMLPIIAADIISRQSDIGTDKKVVAGKKASLSGKGMVGGMGLMAGSMAIGALPEFTGKAMIQSSLNMASMGAMFGPWGAAAGAAAGIVVAGLQSVIEKQEQQKAMAEAVFKPSASLAEYFGNAIQDLDVSITNYTSSLIGAEAGTKSLGESFGLVSAELQQFKDLVESLPEDNPLQQLITGLADESNPEKIKQLVLEFVNVQVALNQIKPDQAQKAIDLILAASNKTALIGDVFFTLETRVDAVTQSIVAAGENANTLGDFLIRLTKAASNSESLEQLQVIIDGIAASGLNAAQAIDAMYYAYLRAGADEAAEMTLGLSQIEGILPQDITAAQVAVTKGMDLKTGPKTTVEELRKMIGDFNRQNIKPIVTTETAISKQLKSQVDGRKSQIELLKQQKKLIDDKLKKEKETSNELKRQNELVKEQQSLDQKIAEAKMAGNYIEASMLEQEKFANIAEFNDETRIIDLQAQSDALQDKIDALTDANEKTQQAIQSNTDATKNNTAAINKQGSYSFIEIPDAIKDAEIKRESDKPSPQNPQIDPATGKTTTGDGNTRRSTSAPILPKDSSGKDTKIKRFINKEVEKNFSNALPSLFTLTQVDTYFRMFPQHKYQNPYRFEPSGLVYLNDKYYGRWYGETDTPGMFARYATGGHVKHYDAGGNVSGPGTATSDSIPAMLSDGEYVVKASAVNKYGVPLLQAINSQKFATGGMVQKFGKGGMPSAPHDMGMQWGGQGDLNSYQKFMLSIARDAGFVDKFFGVDSVFRTLAGKPRGNSDMVYAGLAPLEGLSKVPATALKASKAMNFGSKIAAPFNFIKKVATFPATRKAEAAAEQARIAAEAEEQARITREAMEFAKNNPKPVRPGSGAPTPSASLWDDVDWGDTSAYDVPAKAPSLFSKISNSPFGKASKFIAKPITAPIYFAKDIASMAGQSWKYGYNDKIKWNGELGNRWDRNTLYREFLTKTIGKLGDVYNPKTTALPRVKAMDAKNDALGLPQQRGIDALTMLQKYMMPTAKSGKGWLNLAYSNIPKNLGNQFIVDPLKTAGNATKKFGMEMWNRLGSYKQGKNVALTDFITKKLRGQEVSAYESALFKDAAISRFMPNRISSIVSMMRSVHRSTVPWTDLKGAAYREWDAVMNGKEIPVNAYGPGNYLARAKEISDQSFEGFGNFQYRPTLTLSAMMKLLTKRGYITDDIYTRLRKLPWNKDLPETMYGAMETAKFHMTDPTVQKLLKMGFIGYKHREAATNWLLGEMPGMGMQLIKHPENYDMSNVLTHVTNRIGLKDIPGNFNLESLRELLLQGRQKFHSWNGPIPGPYGQELNAVLKSGTEGVYQEDYMNRLRRDATMNTSTSNSNSVYNNNIVINGTDLNKKELADEVMSRLDRVQKSNNKSNKVVF